MNHRQSLGRFGEQVARRYLEDRGYVIQGTNVRIGRLEIDLIALKDDKLAFVEVRTRQGTSMGTPEESVTARKQARLVAAAEAYVQEHCPEVEDWRIDVVAVELDSKGRVERVALIENAVELGPPGS